MSKNRAGLYPARFRFSGSRRSTFGGVVLVICLDTGGVGQIVVVRRGASDIVKQLRDLEIGSRFFFGGQFLNRFARCLQFGLFDGPCNIDRDLGLDLGVQNDRNRVQAQIP